MHVYAHVIIFQGKTEFMTIIDVFFLHFLHAY